MARAQRNARDRDEGREDGEGVQGRRGWSPLRTALLLVLALALFYGPALAGGRFLYRDTGRMHVPVKQFIGAELRAGRFPAWNPYYGLGMPTVGAAVDGVLHPFTALTAVLPTHAVVTLWILLSHLAAGLGAAAWARRLGASHAAAGAAAFGYAFAGFLVSSTDNLTYLTALATVPWIFAAADLWVARGRPGALGLLALASLLCAAAGDPQGWGIALLGVPAFALLLGPAELPASRRLLRGAIGLAVCVAAAAPVILPLLEWLPHSTRARPLDPITHLRWNLSPLRLLELVVPGVLRDGGGVVLSLLHSRLSDPETSTPWVTSVYVGVAASALAVAAAWRDRRARILAVLALVATWAAMGHHAGFGQVAARLPVLGSFRYWEKLAVWPALLLSVAAALGVDRLRSDAALAHRVALGAAAFGAAALALTLAAPTAAAAIVGERGEETATLAAMLGENLRDGLLHAGAMGLVLAGATWLARRRLAAAPALLAAVVALDLMGANVRAYHLHRPETDRPPSALASWLAARGRLERTLTPFEPLAVRRGFSASESQNWYGALTLSSAWNVAYGVGSFDVYSGPIPGRLFDVSDPLAPNALVPNVGLWDVGFVVVPGDPRGAAIPNVPPSAPIVARDPRVPAWLFEIPHRPRAYVAREVAQVDRAGARAFALDPASASTDRTVVEGAIPPGLAPGEGSAEVVRDEPTAVDVRVHAAAPSLLVLNDAFAPGWRARLGGGELPIVAANYLARGVWVPAGEHVVAFRYSTPGLPAGIAIAALTAAGIGAWALARRRREAAEAAAAAPRG